MTLLEPSVRVTADVYAYMFFCDFFNFLVVIFGFASFGVSYKQTEFIRLNTQKVIFHVINFFFIQFKLV